MPFELACFGTLNAMKVDCIGPLDSEIQEKLKFPDDIGEIHVCREQDNCYILRSTVKSLDGIADFLKKWTDESRVVWRVNKTCPKRNSAGIKNIYWKEFRCQSSNIKVGKKTKKVHKKHTNCPAYMAITIKKITTRCRSRDIHLPKYPTIIKINNNHNHQIAHLDYLKNCPVSIETKYKFLRMYEKGHTPLSALNLHRIDLRGEYGDSIVFSEMDRAICPDNQWCYRLYASFLANKEKLPVEEPVTTELRDNKDSVTYSESELDADSTMHSNESVVIECDKYFYDTSENIECIENIECEDTIVDLPIETKYIPEDADTSVQQVDDFCIENLHTDQLLSLNISDDQIKKLLSPFVHLMTRKLKSAPELFVPSLEVFNNRLKFFETDLDLSEAIHGFGK